MISNHRETYRQKSENRVHPLRFQEFLIWSRSCPIKSWKLLEAWNLQKWKLLHQCPQTSSLPSGNGWLYVWYSHFHCEHRHMLKERFITKGKNKMHKIWEVCCHEYVVGTAVRLQCYIFYLQFLFSQNL